MDLRLIGKRLENSDSRNGGLVRFRDYLKATKSVLLDSQCERGVYKCRIDGHQFLVCPNVFSPLYFRETEIFARCIPFREGEDFLEIGCGTGVISVIVALRGAKRVVAADINSDAVENTRYNVSRFEVRSKVEVRKGDLFQAILSGEKFDTIFWNTPHGYIERETGSELEAAVFDPWYRATERFIKQGRDHLKPDGRLLIGFSSTLGRLDLMQKFCAEAGLQLRLLHEEWSEEGGLSARFELFEAK